MAYQVNKSIIVKGGVADIFSIWADVERFPDMMESIKQVEKTGERTSHWVANGPGNKTFEWDAETTTLEPGRRIAWNSTGGDVKTTGQVTFVQLPQGQTQVTVTLQYTPTKHDLPDAAATEVRLILEEQLLDNLRSFKRYAEANHGGM